MATVLAVEEDPSAADLASNLGLLGHDIRIVATPLEAIEVLVGEPPDVLLLDWQMLEMGGLETIKEIEARGLREAIRLIVLSSRGSERDIFAAWQAGADAVVEGRPSLSELDDAISEVLSASPEWIDERRRGEIGRARLLSLIEEEE